MTVTDNAPDTVAGQAAILTAHRLSLVPPATGPTRLDAPDPRRVAVEGLHRLRARLQALAEGWTAEADREYADEVPALLPQLSVRLARKLFADYAVAVQRVADYDAMSEPERRDEWGTLHLTERAAMADDRDLSLAALIAGHPYHPSWSGSTAADPAFMADLLHQRERELLDERTERARLQRRYVEALDHNDSLAAVVDAFRSPAPYEVTHLAAVPAPAESAPVPSC